MEKKIKLAILGGEPSFPEKIELAQPSTPNLEELTPLLQEIIDRRWLTNDGKFLKSFELDLKSYLDSSCCRVFCNGTIALNVASRALKFSGEVITTPFTFPATVHSLSWNSLTPVFCDIDPETYNLDPEKLESLITPKTTGILGVHVFGNPCEVEKIKAIARKHNLKVIYDAAHSFGVKLNGKSIAGFGDASVFSFHATKIFNTLEGGCITCSDLDLNRMIGYLRNFGIRSESDIVEMGINGKMDEFRAAVGGINLKRVSTSIQKREALVMRYKEAFKGILGLNFQKMTEGTSPNYSYFTIKISANEFGLSRDEVYLCMRSEGVMVRKYFWPLCSDFPIYQNLPSTRREALPNAVKVSGEILALPLYDELAIEDQDKIISLVEGLYARSREIKVKLKSLNADKLNIELVPD